MPTIKPSYGASPTALTVTNLHSLASASLWQSAAQDNDTAQGMIIRIFVTILTTTTAGSDGDVRVYVAGSVDGGTTFAGGASGSEGSYTVVGNSDEQLRLVDIIPIDASETTARTYRSEILLSNPPKDYSLVIENNTGAALGATTNAISILIEQFISE